MNATTEKLNPDVVLIDLKMPEMAGFEASRPRRDAYSYPDEEAISDLAGEITLSHPEIFCLPEVAPDEFEAAFDWFLS